jgi:hypothetical protein
VLGRFDAIRILFGGVREVFLEVSNCSSESPTVRLHEDDEQERLLDGVRTACGSVFELAVPFGELGFAVGDEVEFVVEFAERGGAVTRHPRESSIRFRVPTPEFERRMWTA